MTCIGQFRDNYMTQNNAMTYFRPFADYSSDRWLKFRLPRLFVERVGVKSSFVCALSVLKDYPPLLTEAEGSGVLNILNSAV